MVIVIGGMIGLGKTTVAEILAEQLGSQVFYESVDDNPILPLFYTSSKEEIEAKRYPFLLQLYFLNSRFKTIKDALQHENNIIDRSIYEDWYFAKRNRDLGRISDLEFEMYEKLLKNMMEELTGLPKKAPDLMVYLKGSFETVLKRIQLRGRSYELDQSLVDYYEFLWENYDDWVLHHYKASKVVMIDMDKYDVRNASDRHEVIQLITQNL
ncbi:deoxynucleoside kinase [Paracholeplasma manati]|uniref:deoxynucleoside kinase n=1 Tax=Paracholeplasma manati TaxID=591373 RepID=UPI0024082E51|nr:deoxynucleoside kinase [Paracholeplasma manati]MDG0888355.1 deoxynucleoside kinase [Paracholeplasma manati]